MSRHRISASLTTLQAKASRAAAAHEICRTSEPPHDRPRTRSRRKQPSYLQAGVGDDAGACHGAHAAAVDFDQIDPAGLERRQRLSRSCERSGSDAERPAEVVAAANRDGNDRDRPALQRVHGMVQRAVAARDGDVGCAGFGFSDDGLAKRGQRLRVGEDRVARAADSAARSRVLVPARVRVAGGDRDDHRQPQSLHWRSHHHSEILRVPAGLKPCYAV